MATFQSTLSMRRATEWCNPQPSTDEISIHALHEESDLIKARMRKNEMISIHALHEESDFGFDSRAQCRWYFNPRSP
mgnify:CR=1 FL=1